jgi:hypothetical protein
LLNVLDLWKSAEAVAALEGAGRQIGLAPEQARAAAFALTPAFLMALRQNAMRDPAALGDLMRRTGAGGFAALFEQGLQAFTPQRKAEAEDVVSRLFGPEVSRLVAQQSAMLAGITPEAVRQMMPLVTGLMVGGLARSTPAPSAPNPYAAMMRAWFPAAEPPPKAPEPNPWEDVFAAMFGLPPKGASEPGAPKPATRKSAAPKPAPKPEPPPGPEPSADPFGDMMRAMMGLPTAAPPPELEREPEPEPEPEPRPDPAGAWGEALRAGQEAQKRHIEALQSIFDQAWRPPQDAG